MVHNRTLLERAAGKLISTIQREWIEEMGEPGAEVSEAVMNSAHILLAAAKKGSLKSIVGEGTVSDFLGKEWVESHAKVWPHVQVLEAISLVESVEKKRSE